MNYLTTIQNKIVQFILSPPIDHQSVFEEIALDIFRYQSTKCSPYSQYIELLKLDPKKINRVDDIPFIPIQLFKTSEIYSSPLPYQTVFTSSSTTGMVPSRHFIADLSLYELSFIEAFKSFYGSPQEYHILALLPSYLEREGSSLVYMTKRLIELTGSKESGFYLNDYNLLEERLKELKRSSKKTILLGVSFALVEFASQYRVDFPNLIVMETGGMKGRGKEMSREEIHKVIKSSFGVESVHSEYGMAELLSQAYSDGNGLFRTPHWMRFTLRDLINPFKPPGEGEIGGLNIIDLANIYSCSFIETEDLANKKAGNLWQIPGRISNSQIRGCNLLLG